MHSTQLCGGKSGFSWSDGGQGQFQISLQDLGQTAVTLCFNFLPCGRFLGCSSATFYRARVAITNGAEINALSLHLLPIQSGEREVLHLLSFVWNGCLGQGMSCECSFTQPPLRHVHQSSPFFHLRRHKLFLFLFRQGCSGCGPSSFPGIHTSHWQIIESIISFLIFWLT